MLCWTMLVFRLIRRRWTLCFSPFLGIGIRSCSSCLPSRGCRCLGRRWRISFYVDDPRCPSRRPLPCHHWPHLLYFPEVSTGGKIKSQRLLSDEIYGMPGKEKEMWEKKENLVRFKTKRETRWEAGMCVRVCVQKREKTRKREGDGETERAT